MATNQEYIEYVCDQIPKKYNVRYRKMFGEYMVYVNEKPILLVCDNTVYVKMLEELKNLMTTADKNFPYQGSKEHYILPIDDSEFSNQVIAILEHITPIPKKRTKKER